MFEKNLKIGYLLDFYGELLPERKQTVMELYYNEDLSLAEIAEEIGISRQGVHELIKKSEEELRFYEEKLGLAERMKSVEEYADTVSQLAKNCELPAELHSAIENLMHAVRQS